MLQKLDRYRGVTENLQIDYKNARNIERLAFCILELDADSDKTLINTDIIEVNNTMGLNNMRYLKPIVFFYIQKGG